jgi:hypothetical protein
MNNSTITTDDIEEIEKMITILSAKREELLAIRDKLMKDEIIIKKSKRHLYLIK